MCDVPFTTAMQCIETDLAAWEFKEDENLVEREWVVVICHRVSFRVGCCGITRGRSSTRLTLQLESVCLVVHVHACLQSAPCLPAIGALLGCFPGASLCVPGWGLVLRWSSCRARWVFNWLSGARSVCASVFAARWVCDCVFAAR